MMEAYYLKVEGRENKGYLPILVILSNRACQTSMGFHAIYTHKRLVSILTVISYMYIQALLYFEYIYVCMYV